MNFMLTGYKINNNMHHMCTVHRNNKWDMIAHLVINTYAPFVLEPIVILDEYYTSSKGL